MSDSVQCEAIGYVMLCVHEMRATARGDGYDVCQHAWLGAISHIYVTSGQIFNNINVVCSLHAINQLFKGDTIGKLP
jgi:hypothetical protein